MKTNYIILLFLFVFLSSCENEVALSSIKPEKWSERQIQYDNDTLRFEDGTTYLSLYSHIYTQTENRMQDLTATVSLRNPNPNDSIFIHSAEYFNTTGHSVRKYFSNTIYLAPLETVEIVIDHMDKEGGSGANFLFEWSINKNTPPPIFEAVMISMYGQQGLSFSTTGVRIK